MIVCPGNLEYGGGIGRQMGYFLAARDAGDTGPVYRVIDSRGPWFLGSSPWRIINSVLYLAGAAAVLLCARFHAEPVLAHINITGRGSTLRKIVLAGAARVAGVPYLLHVHDYDYVADYARRNPLMKTLVRSMFGAARRVLVLGGTARATLLTAVQLAPEQVYILHNAVPDPLPPIKPALAVGDNSREHSDPCRLLFLGHLSARKGVPELLHALARPALRELDWHATVAGGGPVAEYRRLAAELGLGDQVAFPGWVDQEAVTALCGRSTVLVLPSHAEGLAMSVLEGLSHGLALVITPVGAHPEVIEDGVSGIFVAPANVDELAATLARVIKNKVLRTALQDGARRRFLESFEISGYARRLGQLHYTLLFGAAHESAEPHVLVR